jgi:UDP-N-acetylmuramoyl-tripeptide--D-alanyl-D-alanine ligase
MSAMHHGAVMEGSWGSESTMVADADAALALLRAELQPGDVVLVKASNAAGLGALAEALVAEPTMRPEAEEERGDRDVAEGVAES